MGLRVSRTTERIIQGGWVLMLVALVAGIVVLERNERNLGANRPERGGVVDRPVGNAPVVRPDMDVDETPVTEQQIFEWTVAPDRPRFLSVPRIGVRNSRVREVGLTENGEVGTPVNIFDVAWFNGSNLPGHGGAMLITGHNGGPTMAGVFDRLGELVIGDEIIVEQGDGTILTFVVAETQVVNMEEAQRLMGAMMISAEAGREGLNLITCTGSWVAAEETFDHRVFLRAVRV